MEKRTIVFLILSVIILITYPYFLHLTGLEMPGANAPQSKEAAPPAAEAPAPAPPAAAEAPTPARTVTPAPAGPAPAPVAGAEGPARDIPIETDLYTATLSTRGGVLTDWELKRYFEDDRVTPVRLLQPPEAGAVTYPLTVSVEGTPGFEDGVWHADGGAVRVSGGATRTLRLTRTDPKTGATLVKTLVFHGNDYTVDVVLDGTAAPGPVALSLGSNFGIRQWGKLRIGFEGVADLVDGDVHREKAADMTAAPITRQGEIAWTVTEGKYFIAALIPETPPTSVVSRAVAPNNVVSALVAPPGGELRYTLYAGPKDYRRLKAFDVNLQENIDFGWFMFGSWSFVRLLAEPMFLLLTTIDRAVGNYGVSIILLTLLIKTVFIPLTHKSYRSMKAMQAIQPQVKALQEKYKNNKEKLSRETMALYREHKINPLGGCLPMFVQIPFFIAFFNILYTTIELRHTPFMGWITDLSAKDPYYILPVIMGISMFVQQKVQPTTMDPKQARLMMFLPVVFTFFFMNFPAGLVLYWLFNNLFTVTQQYITVKFLTKPRVPGAPAPARRKG
jgi:YidC/Oxa1 family membrane protein insertase